MDPFLTPEQELALTLIFALQDESRINRTLPEYMAMRHGPRSLPRFIWKSIRF